MTPSSDWHARLGPLDFSVGIRHFELRGVFPEQPHAPADAAAAGTLPRAGGADGRAQQADGNTPK